ncbi:hypothetical protein HAX54_043527 [Datura stramonium]|uniref:RWP-RK domain-containing protein n=1 Tax=Datura stramonium TaxID=4076 RepID=A0ABS8SNK9_DATST|nr:hypothetical protein [Datura stramonium]
MSEDQDKSNLGIGSHEEEYCYNYGIGFGSPLICCPSPGTLSWQAQCWSEIPTGLVPAVNLTTTHGENVEIIHNNNNNNNGKILSKKLFCFADGHILDPQRADLFYLDLSKRAYQITIHRHNGFDSFSLTKVIVVSDLVQLLKVFLSSKVRLMFLIDEAYSLLTDELNLIGTGQPHLQMEVEFAFSLHNLMRSTMGYAISQASSSRKTNSQNVKAFVVCEIENEHFLDQAADNSGHDSSQSIQSFLPTGRNIKLSPCRVASVVYSLYLYGEVDEDLKILGRVSDITSSVCISSVKFSYRTEGHSQDYHFHGNLSLSLLVPTEESPIGFFEIVYCPQRAHLTSKVQQSPPSINKQKQYDSSPYLDSAVVQSSSNGRPMLLEALEGNAIASHESQEVIVDGPTNIQTKRNKSRTIWTAAELISLEDLEQNYGKKREEAAESLQVSVSTFKRICRKFGIPRWPSGKRKKDERLISVTDEVRTSQLPQNSMPCEDRETTSVSRQKRKRKVIEADNVDANNHFEKLPFEIQNCSSKKQAVDCSTKDSSCLNSISGAIEGVNEGQSLNSESINVSILSLSFFSVIISTIYLFLHKLEDKTNIYFMKPR